MRYQSPKLSFSDCTKTRIKSKFLWFPKCFNGDCRWLETAKIIETVLQAKSLWSCIINTDYEWTEKGFAEEEEENNYV